MFNNGIVESLLIEESMKDMRRAKLFSYEFE